MAAQAGEDIGQPVRNAERLKFFTDAVVAIAMTLLILPLLESIAEASKDGGTPREWLADHGGQLFSFILSFAIIAMFWRSHHHLFEGVRGFTPGLMMLNLAWMFGIVWLPVPTAITGSDMPTDIVSVSLYIGTMLVTNLLMLAMAVHLDRRPDLLEVGATRSRHAVAVAAAMAILFTVALVAALIYTANAPAPSPENKSPAGAAYFALFALFLTGPLQALIHRRLTRHETPTSEAGSLVGSPAGSEGSGEQSGKTPAPATSETSAEPSGSVALTGPAAGVPGLADDGDGLR